MIDDTKGLGLNVGDECYNKKDLWELVQETKKLGTKYVREGRHQDAVHRYSETIMQCRKFGEMDQVTKMQGELNEVPKPTEPEEVPAGLPAKREIREMIASCYLNLSLCFGKIGQHQHAFNTAHRAMVGDEEPPNPEHDVLTDAQKAKSLYRKAQAGEHLDAVQRESLVQDLKRAREFDPSNGDIPKMITRLEKELKALEKKQAKKMGGFLKGKSLGDDKAEASGASTNASTPDKKATFDAVIKENNGKEIQPGLYETGKGAGTGWGEGGDENDVAFFDNVCDELADLMANDPEKFKALKAKMKAQCEAEGALPEQLLGGGGKEDVKEEKEEEETAAAA